MKKPTRPFRIFCLTLLLLSGSASGQALLVNGLTVEGTVSAAEPEERWFFTAEAGAPLTVSVADPTLSSFNLNPRVRVYGPRGWLLADESDPQLVEIDLVTDVRGTYTLVVNGDSGSTGGYTLGYTNFGAELFVAEGDDGKELVSGKAESGSIPVGDSDQWTFEGSAGDTCLLNVTDPGLNSANLNPRVRVYQPDGTEIFDTHSDAMVMLDFILDLDGTHLVVVSGSGSSNGGYTIDFTRLPGKPVIEAQDDGGDLVSGAVATGNISAGDMDPWYFQAGAGESVLINVADPSLQSSNFNPRLRVYAPDGTKLFDRADPLMVRMEFTVDQTGEYLVLLADSGTGSGDYRIDYMNTVGAHATPPGDQGDALANGAAVLANIAPSDMDQWTFSLDAGDYAHLNVTDTSLASGNLNPRVRVYSPDRLKLFDTASDTSVKLDFVADEAGEYLLVVTDQFAGSGDYRAHFLRVPGIPEVPPGDHGGALSVDFPSTGNIQAGDLDPWTFEVAAGRNVELSVVDVQNSSAFLNPLVHVYDPDRNRLFSDASPTDVTFSFTPDLAGEYLVVVSGTGISAGEYRIDLSTAASTGPVSHAGAALANGVLASGTLDIGEVEQWTFEAGLGDHVMVAVHEVASSSAFDSRLRIIAPDGTELFDVVNEVTAQAEFEAPRSGTYQVLVSDSDLLSAFSYGLLLSRAGIGEQHAAPAESGGGQLIDGLLNSAAFTKGDYDQWTFDAQLGDHILINVHEVDSSSSRDSRLRLYAPDGTRLLDSADEVTVFADFAAPQSGTYLAIVSDSDARDEYSYGLQYAAAGVGTTHTAPNGDGGGQLVNGLLNSVSFTKGDYDQWTFDAQLGDHVLINVHETTSSSAFDSRLRIHAPDGTRLVDFTDPLSASADFAAPQSGTYLAIVSDSDLRNEYNYGLQYAVAPIATTFAVPPGDGGGELINGLLNNVAFTTGDYDQWIFDAQLGDHILLTLFELAFSSAFDSRIRLYAPDGTEIIDVTNAVTAFADFAAPQSGAYLAIVADSDVREAYSYGLDYSKVTTLARDIAGFDADDLLDDLTLNGTILFGEIDHWTFDAVAGDVVTLTFAESGSNFSPWMRVFAPDGSLLFNEATSSTVSLEMTIPQTGSYYVRLSDDNYQAAGNYAISFSNSRIPSLLVNPTEFTAYPGWIIFGKGQDWSTRGPGGFVRKVRDGWMSDHFKKNDPWLHVSATTAHGSWIHNPQTNSWRWVPLAADNWSWLPATQQWVRNWDTPN